MKISYYTKKNMFDNLFSKSIKYYKKYGLTASLNTGIIILRRFSRSAFHFSFGRYYIWGNEFDETTHIEPNLKGLYLKYIYEPSDIDTLINCDYDLSSFKLLRVFRNKLEKGGILLLIFINKKIAHHNWIATTEDSNFDPIPFDINFNCEACIGPSFTFPEFRSMGLNHYAYSEMFVLLKNKGFKMAKLSSRINIIAQVKTQAKVGTKIIGKGVFIRFLLWKYWIPYER